MKKLYIQLSECELNAIRNYAKKHGVQSYRSAIEQLIEENAVSVLCIISAIEKNLRKTAVNFRQIESFIQVVDPVFGKEITGTLYPAIQSISAFTSDILRNIQRSTNDRFEVQIRLADDTKEMLKTMKKTGCFRTYDALLRFMLSTHFTNIDFDELESCFSTIKEVGESFNQAAHSFHMNHSADLTKLRQIMPEYQSAIGVVIEIIGDK